MPSGSDRCSPGSEDSISALSGPGSSSPSKRNWLSSDVPCLPATGPESPDTPTSDTLLFVSNQRREIREMDVAPALSATRGGFTQEPFLSTGSPEVPPARTSASPADGEVLRADDPGCSSSSQGSPMSLFDQEDGSSLRTSPACFLPTVDEISESFSARWATSGFTISPGECWTAVTSECPSAGGASSSLQDVLLDRVPERFFLSPRAAVGILRRAARRGRALPPVLLEDLRRLASTFRDDGRRTTAISSPPSTEGVEESTTTRPRPAISSELCGRMLDRDRTRATSSGLSSKESRGEGIESERTRPPEGISLQLELCPSSGVPMGTPTTSSVSGELGREPPSSTSISTSPDLSQEAPTALGDVPRTIPTSSLRRLTPTERERLQGFPDGWTLI